MISEMVERTVFQDLAPRQIHYIQPVKRAEAHGLVADVYQHMPADEDLVSAVAWASFTAARKVGTWLTPLPKERSKQ